MGKISLYLSGNLYRIKNDRAGFGVVPEWQKGYRWLYDMGRNTASEKVYSFRGNRNAVDRRFQP